eukprot:m.151922 g.151922  ORF g.151922 m.151922 type:complete len:53 (+) comp17426_c1_seq1:269-427(+)
MILRPVHPQEGLWGTWLALSGLRRVDAELSLFVLAFDVGTAAVIQSLTFMSK